MHVLKEVPIYYKTWKSQWFGKFGYIIKKKTFHYKKYSNKVHNFICCRLGIGKGWVQCFSKLGDNWCFSFFFIKNRLIVSIIFHKTKYYENSLKF